MALTASVSLAEEPPENQVPKTFDGSGEAFREGGKEIGEGFRSVGRGIKKTFKGEAAKEDYKDGKQIGEGFKDIGLGTAGGGRAVGRSVKKGVEANEEQGEGPDPGEASSDSLREGRSAGNVLAFWRDMCGVFADRFLSPAHSRRARTPLRSCGIHTPWNPCVASR
jgi:hypothetical protein